MQTVTTTGRTNDTAKCSDPNSIYSTPMHITIDIKVTSDVAITIQRLAGEENLTMWSRKPVLKFVLKLFGALVGSPSLSSEVRNRRLTLTCGR
jgi:hypothetical protein